MATNSLLRSILTPHRLKISHFCSTTPSQNLWNLLQTIQSHPNPEQTLTKFGRTQTLDSSTISDALQRCSKTHQSILGLRFFIWAGIQPGYRHSTWMYNQACRILGIDQMRETLIRVLESYKKEGCLVKVKTFKVILNLCREAKLADEALEVLRKMGEFNCRPDTTSFNLVIRLFCDKGDVDVCLELMNEMALIDLYPDMITYVSMIKGFCNAGRFEDGYGLLEVMRGHGCVPNVVAYSTLLDGVCKNGNLDRAMELLGEMENVGGVGCVAPNVVTYTSVIQSLCDVGRIGEALGILDRMKQRGCLPNRVTVSTLIKGLCNVGRVDEAYKLIDEVVSLGSVIRDECYSSLIVCLMQNNNMEEAERIFRKMLIGGMKPDGLSCSLFLRQLCLDGRFLDAFEEIENIESSVTIDSDIYGILLAGLCERSHLNEAAKLANITFDKGIRLKAPFVDGVLEYLNLAGEGELASRLTS
ncbi:hypothetical protein Scep_008551 [Stephania cephalantha]|uniref:Pentatricopeptide repeat-containing protein n=1 Tax=Stephania cephalantha TaxID=152367 RepID=A0AAP0KDW2_9MAGN